jgi:hypothetical protein
MSIQAVAAAPGNRKRVWLWNKTAGHCAYCGYAFNSWGEMTIDHLVPRARNGSRGRENKFPACQSCNSSKGRRPLSYLRDALQRQLTGRPSFTPVQLEWLRAAGFEMPHEEPYRFYWERLGNTFPDDTP